MQLFETSRKLFIPPKQNQENLASLTALTVKTQQQIHKQKIQIMTDEDSLQHLADRRCCVIPPRARSSTMSTNNSKPSSSCRTACRIVECPHFTPPTSGTQPQRTKKERTNNRRDSRLLLLSPQHDYSSSFVLSNNVTRQM